MASQAPRLRLFVLLVLVALIGVGLWAWSDYRDPKKVWSRAIRSPDATIQAAAWARLQEDEAIWGLDREQSVKEVFTLLDDPDTPTRLRAVSVLPRLHPDPIKAVPRLADRLKDQDLQIRLKAAEALGEVVSRGGPERERAVEALAKGLDDPSPEVRAAP